MESNSNLANNFCNLEIDQKCDAMAENLEYRYSMTNSDFVERALVNYSQHHGQPREVPWTQQRQYGREFQSVASQNEYKGMSSDFLESGKCPQWNERKFTQEISGLSEAASAEQNLSKSTENFSLQQPTVVNENCEQSDEDTGFESGENSDSDKKVATAAAGGQNEQAKHSVSKDATSKSDGYHHPPHPPHKKSFLKKMTMNTLTLERREKRMKDKILSKLGKLKVNLSFKHKIANALRRKVDDPQPVEECDASEDSTSHASESSDLTTSSERTLKTSQEEIDRMVRIRQRKEPSIKPRPRSTEISAIRLHKECNKSFRAPRPRSEIGTEAKLVRAIRAPTDNPIRPQSKAIRRIVVMDNTEKREYILDDIPAPSHCGYIKPKSWNLAGQNDQEKSDYKEVVNCEKPNNLSARNSKDCYVVPTRQNHHDRVVKPLKKSSSYCNSDDVRLITDYNTQANRQMLRSLRPEEERITPHYQPEMLHRPSESRRVDIPGVQVFPFAESNIYSPQTHNNRPIRYDTLPPGNNFMDRHTLQPCAYVQPHEWRAEVVPGYFSYRGPNGNEFYNQRHGDNWNDSAFYSHSYQSVNGNGSRPFCEYPPNFYGGDSYW